ncbi:MAG: carbohydrate binding domain-containing protein [Planctomycetes bacterium]|nr:carbohydrate binding domain-containing protein [Planctomycetota bacterium]
MNTQGHPRGSVYITVLGAALLITIIGLSVMFVQQVQNRTASGASDYAEARLYARSALESGMYVIYADSLWRTHFGNGAWCTDVPIGSGTFSLEAMDPVDGNVPSGASDPVVLTGTGCKGEARYRMQVKIETAQTLGACLEVSMHAGHDLITDGATLNSDQFISANHYTIGQNGAKIYADAEAVNSISGGTYYKATRSGIKPRTIPNSGTALNYYITNGTPIAYSDLRLWGQTEILVNTWFEIATAPWYAVGACTLSRSVAYRKDGVFSLRVSGRANAGAVAAQDLDLAKILNGNRYYVRLPVLLQAPGTGQACLTIESTDGGIQVFSTPPVAMAANTWVDLAGEVTPTWTGQLVKATVSVVLNTNAEYYMDAVTVYDTSYPADSYVMDRALLGPTVNPFGSRQTNPQGIYVLNCSSKKVIIANSRIVGTLVILGANTASSIRGPVAWEPAVPNYPALLTDTPIPIGLGSAALSEATMNTNFNPTGTPYPYVGGTQNLDTNDAYPSLIRGLIYSTGNLVFQNSTAVEGVVVSHKDITVQAGGLNVKYKSTWLNNPPPGFGLGSTKKIQTVAGTWRRIVP